MSLSIVDTQYGKLEGEKEDGYTIFKGIPYAKPPVGDLRWRAPRKPDHWDGIRKADTFPCKSMQESLPNPFYDKEFYDNDAFCVDASEDSLYLNIWTPACTAGENLPVIFYIHGGAFMGGFGSEKEFDGEAYCKRDVILVTVNYRLNIFGFLAHPWFMEEDTHHVTGNYGILDQIAALEWVYHNIRSFGGNPDNITIMGQSAGAMSVQTLISSPLTGSMIAKAIMQSGGGYDNGMNDDMKLEDALAYGRTYVELTGAKSAEELRNKTTEELYAALGPFMGEMMKTGRGLVLKPNIDGYVLREDYNSLIEKGAVKRIPYLLGSNKNDIFVEKADADADVRSKIYQGCVDFSHKLKQAGHDPAYVYFFKRQMPGDDAGAFHSAELWYTFGTLNRCWRPLTEADHTLSKTMIDFWANFAGTGNPNAEGSTKWKPCTEEDPFVMEFDV